MSDETICEAFSEVINLAMRANAPVPLTKLDGCWEHQVDDHWWIALNGHAEPRECSDGPTVRPYNCYVRFNGWPAGVIDPFGGIIAAGEIANEDALIEALKAARP